MDKQQVIEFIKRQIEVGVITRSDLYDLIGKEAPETIAQGTVGASDGAIDSLLTKSLSLNYIFYAIGSIIVLVGIIILLMQNWDDIGMVGRVGSTLGIAILTYVLGLSLSRTSNHILAQVMLFMSALLAPVGSFVFLHEAGVDLGNSTVALLVSLALTIVYAVAFVVARKDILILVVGAFATWFYYAAILELFDFSPTAMGDLLRWATMIAGVSYLLIGHTLRTLWLKSGSLERVQKLVLGLFFGLGTAGVLGVMMAFGGFYDVLIIPFIFAGFYGSVYLRSYLMLIVSALFLMSHLIKLTAEYFVDSIGWPVALILIGFLIIGIGYSTFYIGRHYLKKDNF